MSWSEKDFEEQMTPFINDIYQSIFGKRLVDIIRYERDSEQSDERMLFMDKELAIDTHLHFTDGTILTFQEKTRRHNYARFDDFTFEYYNDPQTKEKGEWFKLAAQLYFYGYANKDKTGYQSFWVVNIAKMRTALMSKIGISTLERKYLRHNKPPAKANFFAIPFSLLENLDGVVLLKRKL